MIPDKALHWRDLPAPVLSLLRQGSVIPAHPLALGPDRQFDKQSQRAISRYYVDAGSGGLAVGVHSTQFADPRGRALSAGARACRSRRRASGPTGRW